MRELKFRVWDGKKLSKPFGFDNLFGYEGEQNAVNVEPSDDYKEHFTLVRHNSGTRDGSIPMMYPQIRGKNGLVEGLVIEQFTGLLDRNGREIYEGDVVRLIKNKKVLGEVVWREATPFPSFVINDNQRDGEYTVGKFNRELWEVVGNRHENPQLITD